MSVLIKSSGSTNRFDSESQQVVRKCHLAFSELVYAIPGKINSASDLQRALKINMKLAWKIYKIANDSSIDMGILIPGAQNVRDLIGVAKQHGIDPSIIEHIREAMDEFDKTVALHAGDRSTFDSMISANASDDQSDALTYSQKRSAFRVNRHLRGVQAKSQIKSLILAPSTERTSLLDLVAIQGYQELRRLRYECPLVVSRVRLSDDDKSIRRSNWEPLGPVNGHSQSSSVLGKFCSPNLPPFRAVRNESDFMVGELLSNGIGNQSAITYIDGYTARAAVPRFRDEHNQQGAMLTWVPIPCEVLVMDLVIHEEALGSLNPLVGCYCDMFNGNQLPEVLDTYNRLPLNENMVYLGKGLPVLRSSDIDRHSEMYSAVFDNLGWDPQRFEVYRCRISFPVMLSSVLVRFELPESEGNG